MAFKREGTHPFCTFFPYTFHELDLSLPRFWWSGCSPTRTWDFFFLVSFFLYRTIIPPV